MNDRQKLQEIHAVSKVAVNYMNACRQKCLQAYSYIALCADSHSYYLTMPEVEPTMARYL